ncbi:glycosyltransferase family 2 protein [Rhodococcus sp. SMB37]|uniref:glycosyltransferase family 2 protein n=1 Tax=Rhodococcus sp. SMB37 TaxID=2512213 RepID=UPI0013053BFA|nr:glycosyltransferase family 2 protein [Rhodococcus sp. SMB37]
MIDKIIVAYNTQNVLAGCIESLSDDGNIYVVNNSPEAPLGIESSARVTVLEPGENLGFGRGVNYASERVKTEYVAIVNPDLVVDRGTLELCVQKLDESPNVALLSPRVYVNGSLFPTSEHEVSLPRYLAHSLGFGDRFGVARSVKAHRQTHKTDAVNGAFMVARREALDQVMWFDKSIFLFGEEIDLCRRLRRRGWSVLYLAAGHVDHLDGYSSGEAKFDVRALRRQARVEQLRRARGPVQARIYEAILKIAAKGASVPPG